MHIKFARAPTASHIDTTVAGNAEKPGRERGFLRIVEMGLLPEDDHHLLDNFLGLGDASVLAHQEGFEPRREKIEEFCKSDLVTILCDSLRKGGEMLSCVNIHSAFDGLPALVFAVFHKRYSAFVKGQTLA